MNPSQMLPKVICPRPILLVLGLGRASAMTTVIYDVILFVNGCQMSLQVVLGAEAFVTRAARFQAVMWLCMFLFMFTARKSASIQERAESILTLAPTWF